MKRFVVLLVLAGCCVDAWAQGVVNPNALPLGDKESLMANTGTGGIGSPGAVYYNPAALTMLDGTYLSLSGSAYLVSKFRAEPVARLGNTDLDFEGQSFESIPTSVIMVRRFGPWHLALGLLVPMQFTYEGRTNWTVPLFPDELNLEILQNFRERLFLGGLSAARRIDETWSAGVSVFLQSYSYLSFAATNGYLASNPARIVQNTTRESISSSNALIVAGLQKSIGNVNIGLRAALPGVFLTGRGDYYSLDFSNLGSNPFSDRVELPDRNATYYSPFDLTIGVATPLGKRLTLAIDGAYRAGHTYRPIEDVPVLEPVETKGTFRCSGGFEWRAGEKLAVYAGGSFTPSSIAETETSFGQDFWSACAGAKLKQQHLAPALGFYFSQGRGEGDLPGGAGRTVQTQMRYGVLLGSSFMF